MWLPRLSDWIPTVSKVANPACGQLNRGNEILQVEAVRPRELIYSTALDESPVNSRFCRSILDENRETFMNISYP